MEQVPVPKPADYGLKAQIHGPTEAHPGDTLQWVVSVTWESAPHPWLVMPQNAADGKGLSQVSVGVEQHREFKEGREIPSIHVRYQIAVTDTGALQIPNLRYEIPTPQGAMVLETAPFSVRSQESHTALFGVLIGVGLALLAVILYFRRRWMSRRRLAQGRDQQGRELARRLTLLEKRVQTAEVRSFMKDLESLCRDYQAWAKVSSDDPRWSSLETLFREARYGGGPKDQWECRAHLKDVKELLNLNSEEEAHE